MQDKTLNDEIMVKLRACHKPPKMAGCPHLALVGERKWRGGWEFDGFGLNTRFSHHLVPDPKRLCLHLLVTRSEVVTG